MTLYNSMQATKKIVKARVMGLMMDKKIQDQIDEVFQEYDSTETPGCALGIVQQGELI